MKWKLERLKNESSDLKQKQLRMVFFQPHSVERRPFRTCSRQESVSTRQDSLSNGGYLILFQTVKHDCMRK